MFGVQHLLTTKFSLMNVIFEEPSTPLTVDNVRWSLLVNVFGANKRLKGDYMRALSDAQACLTSGLLLEPGVSNLVRKTIRGVQEHTPNLVSFSESAVDQSQWERAADANLQVANDRSKPGSLAVEVNLFSLTRNFVGNVALPSLVGTEFLDVYPKALDDLWDLDDGFNYLTLGLPRWFPIPSLTKAHIARRNLLQGLRSFHGAIDNVAADEEPLPPWIEVRDVGHIMRERSLAWRTHRTPSMVKAPSDLSLLWA